MLGHFSKYHWVLQETFKVSGAWIAVFLWSLILDFIAQELLALLICLNVTFLLYLEYLRFVPVSLWAPQFATSFQIPFVHCLPVKHLLLI